MSRRSTTITAVALCVLALVTHAVAMSFIALGIGISTPGDADNSFAAAGFLVAFVSFPLVGALIATKRPDNLIGWLFIATGLVLAFTDLTSTYADYALFARPGELPLGVWAGWAVSWLDPLFFFTVLLLVLLFPSGHLPSARWRPIAWMLPLGVAGTSLVSALRPGEIFDTIPVDNPAAVEGIDGLINVIDVVSAILFVSSALIIICGVIVRSRRAQGVERLQFKWFAAASGLLVVAFLSFFLIPLGLPDAWAEGFVGIAFAAIAISVGVAVLRYRLYDIDRVISRALVYGSLTVVLGAAYVGLVLAGQRLFSSFAGGSDLAIAVSTLVVAALFLPARGRVQRLVDRRFYRRRYDTQRTLETFGRRLREQVELERLQVELEGVVQETMQPARVSLWRLGSGQ